MLEKVKFPLPAAFVQIRHCRGVEVIMLVESSIFTSIGGLFPNPDLCHQLSALSHQSGQGFLVGVDSGEIRLGNFIVEL